jgi:hypothetical protein
MTEGELTNREPPARRLGSVHQRPRPVAEPPIGMWREGASSGRRGRRSGGRTRCRITAAQVSVAAPDDLRPHELDHDRRPVLLVATGSPSSVITVENPVVHRQLDDRPALDVPAHDIAMLGEVAQPVAGGSGGTIAIVVSPDLILRVAERAAMQLTARRRLKLTHGRLRSTVEPRNGGDLGGVG